MILYLHTYLLLTNETFSIRRQQESSSSEATISKLPVDVDKLASIWEVKNLFPKDLVLWLRQLKIEFLKYTPNPALRFLTRLNLVQFS